MSARRTRMWVTGALTALCLAATLDARAQSSLAEGFDGVFPPPGWVVSNFSTVPQTDWFSGNLDVFPAHAGAAGSYAAANFLATQESGGISVWLITPELAVSPGDIVSFYTRAESVSGASFGDGLELRIGPGSSVSPANFSTVLLELGSVLTGAYPTLGWTQYWAAIPNLGGATTARIAFEYFAEGPEAASYVGIDSVVVSAPGADGDGDGAPDSVDNCPSVPNPSQAEGGSGFEVPVDAVGDACDNCVRATNPRVAANFLTLNPWATLTGGQRDDDHDGYGNKCDAKFTGTSAQAVGGLDLAQQRSASARDRRLDVCGTTGSRPCAIFDLDEGPTGNFIGGLDLGRFRMLNGATPGPRCAACTGTGSALLPCTAGTAGSCAP